MDSLNVGVAKASFSVSDIVQAMEDWAPPSYAYDWDRVGLATGNPDTPVSRVLTCLSITEEVLREALQWKAQMIVSHHPLIWGPLKTLRSDAPHTRLCLELAHANIACFAAHTNLDLAPGGVNDVLCKQLGLVAAAPLAPVQHASQLKVVTFVPATHVNQVRDALSAAGAGTIGRYTHCSFYSPGTGTFIPAAETNPYLGEAEILNEVPELRLEMPAPRARLAAVLAALQQAHPYEEPAYDLIPLENRAPIGLGRMCRLEAPRELEAFAREVALKLGCADVRMVGDGGRRIETVGVIGGSGGDYITQVAGKVDVLVTGDVKYHQALEASELGLAVIDAGHCATERAIAPALAGWIMEHLPGLETRAHLERDLFRTVKAGN